MYIKKFLFLPHGDLEVVEIVEEEAEVLELVEGDADLNVLETLHQP